MDQTPMPEGIQNIYFGHLAQGRFMLQRCDGCERHVFYPRTNCPHCGSAALQWVPASGRGTIYSYSIVRRKPELGGDYNVVLVDLEEGVRCMSRLEGVAADAVFIGAAVQAYVAQQESGPVLLMKPAGAQS